jgi:TolB-like protein
MSSDKDQDYFADGISEELLNHPDAGVWVARHCTHFVILVQGQGSRCPPKSLGD